MFVKRIFLFQEHIICGSIDILNLTFSKIEILLYTPTMVVKYRLYTTSNTIHPFLGFDCDLIIYTVHSLSVRESFGLILVQSVRKKTFIIEGTTQLSSRWHPGSRTAWSPSDPSPWTIRSCRWWTQPWREQAWLKRDFIIKVQALMPLQWMSLL